ncbi:MAG TPA: zinc-ribbon domain-containing protein, partial [Polyangiaceae bacterium]|nr:zinc-ribbon domain-containing protein [Polyangiaceae bacterium]
MDVRCSRCGTDYEFDDTLISERGTTVKCTNCSYQFKIFPPKSADTAPERWTVRTASGRELVFTSLRELQRGISDRKVGPNDLLSRGRQPPRALGSIPELEPFFQSAGTAASRGMKSAPQTLVGVAPPPSGSPRPEKDERPTSRGIGQRGAESPQAPSVNQKLPAVNPAPIPRVDSPGMSSTLPLSNPVPPSGFTQRLAEPMILGAVAPTEPQPVRPPPKPTRSEPPREAASPEAPAEQIPHRPDKTLPLKGGPQSFDRTLPAATPPVAADTNPPPDAPAEPVTPPPPPPPVAPAASPSAARTAPAGAIDATLPVPSQPRRPAPSRPGEPTPPPPPISTRERLPSYDETPHPDQEPGRRARSRWIAGIVFLAVAGLLGLTVGRQYAARLTSSPQPGGSARDERASRFLTEGMKLA